MKTEMMRAVICPKYGAPEVLLVEERPKPIPKNNEVLVKIMAASVNSGDVRVRGLAVGGIMKLIMRLVLGFNKPRKPILGTVFSGIVEEVGGEITDYADGDELFGLTGFKFGTHAEYIALSHKTIMIKKPENATFEEAAALPFGGQTAIYFLNKAKISERTNPSVLIYGATGSVGTAAIQIAKHYNSRVTAVCSTRGKSLVEELEVERVIFYDKEDFTSSADKYDIIFDAVGKTSKKECASLMAEGGTYVSVEGLDVAAEKKEQLELLKELFEKGKYKATIDKVYTLDEIVEAHRYVDTGRKKGSVVVKMAS